MRILLIQPPLTILKTEPKKCHPPLGLVYFVGNFGVKEVSSEDDNLTLDKERAKAVFHGIIDRKLGIVWSVPKEFVYNFFHKLFKNPKTWTKTFKTEDA